MVHEYHQHPSSRSHHQFPHRNLPHHQQQQFSRHHPHPQGNAMYPSNASSLHLSPHLVKSRRKEYLSQPFFRGSCPEFGQTGVVYGPSKIPGFDPNHLRALPEPKCQCSRRQNPLHQMHEKPGGTINSLIPHLQKVVKFNLNPSYSKSPSGTPAAVAPSSSSASYHRRSNSSCSVIASQETGVDLDPDVLSRNKRNLPQAPSFKHPTSPTMPMAKMRALKDMITNTDLNFKRQIQVSPIPRYSREHDFKFGRKTATIDRSMGITSYLRGHPSSASIIHSNQVQRSLPDSPVRTLSRNSPIGSFFGPSIGAANNLTASSTNICSDPTCSDPNCPANFPVLHHVTASSNYPSGRIAFSNPDLRVGCNVNNWETSNYRYSFQPQIHADYSIATPPRYVTASHQHHHQHANQVGQYYSSRCSSPGFCPSGGIKHGQHRQSSLASFLSSINHQATNHHHPSSSIATTTSVASTTNATTNVNSSKQFPSVSEITRPPFMEPTYNCVDKYDYNYDNFYRAKRDKLQPFFRYSPAPPPSRSTTPVNDLLSNAFPGGTKNPFIPTTISVTPPPPGSSICSKTTSVRDTTTALTSSGKVVAANNQVGHEHERNSDVNPSLGGKNVNVNHGDTKQLFKKQLKYFIEERKGELGMPASFQPQTGSESDVTALLNMYSNPPDPVKAKFPPPGASTYQSVPQAYFDPKVASFTPMLTRRHSFGGEDPSLLYRASPSPFPSFYSSYAPPTASSLLHHHHDEFSHYNHHQHHPQTHHAHLHHSYPRTTSNSYSNIHASLYPHHHQYQHHYHNQPMCQGSCQSSCHTARPSSPYPQDTTMYLTGDDALDYALL